jgi:hypothetical protein
VLFPLLLIGHLTLLIQFCVLCSTRVEPEVAGAWLHAVMRNMDMPEFVIGFGRIVYDLAQCQSLVNSVMNVTRDEGRRGVRLVQLLDFAAIPPVGGTLTRLHTDL